MPKVSVIIPSYNQARFVSATIDSVLPQTYPDVEIIVIDDGSTDETRAVLTDYGDTIQTIHQENKGLSGARNTGFRISSGDYVLFLDSDDLIAPRTLACHVSLLEAEPDLGLSYSAWQQISEDGARILGEVRPRKQGHLLKELLRREFFFFASAAVIRRECLEQVGLFDQSLGWGDDADMWLRLARAGYAFGYLDYPHLKYRIRSNSMTASANPGQVQSWMAGLEKFFADPTLPADVRELEPEAYAVLHYETAGRYFRSGDVEPARRHLRQAIRTCPSIGEKWLLEWLAGTALDPRTSYPEQFIERVFDNLPCEAITLRSLRRRARGRYHAAAAFAADQSCDLKRARRHILPALKGDPSLIWNRGFDCIAIRALLG
jgi:hypothetical protein